MAPLVSPHVRTRLPFALSFSFILFQYELNIRDTLQFGEKFNFTWDWNLVQVSRA
jgi:hypothetical protein